ncbi:ELMO domain-containing protein 3-like isoform X2 [Lingula anatina]|uniref:ELMO domain-containing protein 3-like isoform X2 n=1 Tax=Lingula anatina TaxID=7574 RepID=A0A1S3IK74_LINAN|nr:ELMO domain-containing protein 3-like isoform X2 [Lingula anatina]|eukprot:XP_013397919.1 ELMO domain-containing protein 3-like isoform X2 [Lingula anatina]
MKQTSAARTLPAPKWGQSANNKKNGAGEPADKYQEGQVDENGDVNTEMRKKIHCEDGQSESEENSDLAAAIAEWDEVETVTPGAPNFSKQSQPLSFNEALQYYQTKDLSDVRPLIKTSIERRGFAAFKHFLFGPPKLHRELLQERDMIFCIAASQFNNDESVHVRTLQTMFKHMTGSKFDCKRYGDHWDQIGFQGTDPATDLRSVGFLGLLHILYFVKDPKLLSLARDIYKLSLHESQNFPFCLMGINLTRITLQALREDCINKECNKRRQVVAVVNDLYVGLYLMLYQKWKHQQMTIINSGPVLNDLEHIAKTNPRHVLRNLEAYLQSAATSKAPGSPKEKQEFTFSSLDEAKSGVGHGEPS